MNQNTGQPGRVVVLGAGRWGRALGHVLQSNGYPVDVQSARMPDTRDWAADAAWVVLSVPSRFLRAELLRRTPPGCPVLGAVKGIEVGTGLRVSQMVGAVWGACDYAAVSGPSFAEEVLEDQPTAVVVASEVDAVAARAQALLHRPEFRVYRTQDVVGVELGGALKNVYAIAAGACGGLGLGENSRAALITRALAEMARVGVALGGRMETFLGLGGAGDLMLTCYGQASRNRTFGEALGRGCSVEQAQEQAQGVVEGITTVHAARELAEQHGIMAPLLDAVDRLVHGGEPPREILHSLLARPPVEEVRSFA